MPIFYNVFPTYDKKYKYYEYRINYKDNRSQNYKKYKTLWE